MINNKIWIAICCCLAYSAHGAIHTPPHDEESDQSPTSRGFPCYEVRQSIDSLSPEKKDAVFKAIDSVTFDKKALHPNVMSSGFLIRNIKEVISGITVKDQSIVVHFPIVTAYCFKEGNFYFFDVDSITIENIMTGKNKIILNEVGISGMIARQHIISGAGN